MRSVPTCAYNFLAYLGMATDLVAGFANQGTTAEHPFWVQGKGWTAARDLKPGHLLSSRNGQWMPVEEVFETQLWQPVYSPGGGLSYVLRRGQRLGIRCSAHNAKCSSITKVNGKTDLQIKNKFSVGSSESRQLQRFVKAWNEQIGKAGGSLTTRSPSPSENAASALWKAQLRAQYPRAYALNFAGVTARLQEPRSRTLVA